MYVLRYLQYTILYTFEQAGDQDIINNNAMIAKFVENLNYTVKVGRVAQKTKLVATELDAMSELMRYLHGSINFFRVVRTYKIFFSEIRQHMKVTDTLLLLTF